MSPIPRPVKETVMEEARQEVRETAEVRDNLVALFSRGIDRIAELQKRSIDVAVQQQLEWVDIYKKYVQKMPGAPRLPMLEVASTVVEKFADAQKHGIDLSVEQTRAWIDAVKDRASVANKVTETAATLTSQAVERSVAAQKKAVETTVAQTKAVLDATRQQLGITHAPGESAVSSFQKGVDTFVEAQKEMLDLVAR